MTYTARANLLKNIQNIQENVNIMMLCKDSLISINWMKTKMSTHFYKNIIAVAYLRIVKIRVLFLTGS